MTIIPFWSSTAEARARSAAAAEAESPEVESPEVESPAVETFAAELAPDVAPAAAPRRVARASRRRAPGSKDLIHTLETRASYDALADVATGAGAAGMPEVKFLIDRQTHQLYFIPRKYPYHYDFAIKVLGVNEDVEAFNREAYLAPDRHYIAGTLTAYDNFLPPGGGAKGVYGISYWSTDIVRAPMILETYDLIAPAMPFAPGKLVYHPGGQTQEKLLEQDQGADRKALAARKITILTNTELAKNFTFMALNTGKSYGTLRIVHGDGAGDPPTRRDVAIYADDVPATLPPLAGLATPKPQTYLSHDALKARQDHTPYAYSRDILSDPQVRALEGKIVSFEVTPQGYVLKPATQAEADAYFESLRPKETQVLKPDLSVREIRDLDHISFADARAFGTKTTNVAELHKLHTAGRLRVNNSALGEPEVIAPNGFGIPVYFFAYFFSHAKYEGDTTLKERLDELLADPKFQKDPAKRRKRLEELQDAVKEARIPSVLTRKLDAMTERFRKKFPDQDIRIRSSSDSEDLQGFNGAGLFDSYTFHWKDAHKEGKTFADRLKKVFGSVWNERAYAEYDFYRIDPHSVDMGELCMASTEDEIANGVVRWGGAIPGWDTITVNAQVGENLVTNPEEGATPDAIVVGNYGFNGEAEIQYEAVTNQKLLPGRTAVLTDGEIRALFKAMKVVQTRFAELYDRTKDPTFAIECEFKITADGKLLIKQARPWVG